MTNYVDINQISLFDNVPEKQENKPIIEVKNADVNVYEVPEILNKIKSSVTLEELFRCCSYYNDKDRVLCERLGFNYNDANSDFCQIIGNNIFPIRESKLMIALGDGALKFYVRINDKTEFVFIKFNQYGKAFMITAKVVLDKTFTFREPSYCQDIQFSKITKLEKMVEINDDCIILDSHDDIKELLFKTNPYAYNTVVNNKFNCNSKNIYALMLLSPQLEQLYKADFEFAKRFLANPQRYSHNDIDAFNRLTQPGKNLKEIFKCSKTLYTALKGEPQISKWDIYRKMEKQGKFSKDTIVQAIDANYGERELKQINTILNKKYNGKPVFTWDTLQNYLGRLNMFQAIYPGEAFMLLNDYLSMCSQLDIAPRIDSDSLKREHDVTARTLREKRDEIMAKKMEGACEYLKVNDYEEEIYFIRGIRDYNDLIDEAKQQHNCVAGYANSIISRRSLIYVMRRKDSPNQSLITVELDAGQENIRQKLLAYNRPIYNKSQSEFLDRWITKVRQRKKSGGSCIVSGNVHA